MWKRKELKKAAKSAIKNNYRAVVVVCFVVAFLAGGYSLSTLVIDHYYSSTDAPNVVVNNVTKTLTADSLGTILRSVGVITDDNTQGILGGIVNFAVSSGSAISKLINSAKGFLVTHETFVSLVSLISVVLQLLYNVFIRNVIKTGEKRFFMETRLYRDTSSARLSYNFREKRYLKTVKIMMLRSFFQMLWSLTIVGGIIKIYSYRMIPYIVAENPNISAKDAFALSKAMMKGNKWKTFIMDISFVFWHFLSVITFGVVGFFWLNPYLTATETELYMTLRAKAVHEKIPYYKAFCDVDIVVYGVVQGSGKSIYPGAQTSAFKNSKADERVLRAEVTYSATTLILLFFFFSMLGWVWEVLLMLVKNGVFVNRGTMLGPWLPIYGVGGVIALVLLRRFFKNPILTFFMMMSVSGIVEYFTSWLLETTKHVRWWDYSGYFLNINGRICLEGLIIFGLGGCACIYIVAPKMRLIFEKIPQRTKISICAVLIALFALDAGYSTFNPNIGHGITD